MTERNRRGGPWQYILAVLAVYLCVALLPGGIFFLAGGMERAPGPPGFLDRAEEGAEEEISPAPAQEEEPQGISEGRELFRLQNEATGQLFTLTADELLPGALACEMDPGAPEEALKAQAVACYTLFCRRRDGGVTFTCDPERMSFWADEAALRARWGGDYEEKFSRLTGAWQQVRGQLLLYGGEPALTSYFAISSGATEASGDVWETSLPYLIPVPSPGDCFAPGYLSTVTLTEEEFAKRAAALEGAELSGDPASWLTHVELTSTGGVRSAVLGGVKVTGQRLRELFSLRSACFSLAYAEGFFTFTVRGWGHGVGMSQAGAVFLANEGWGYREILSHYYPGTTLAFSV